MTNITTKARGSQRRKTVKLSGILACLTGAVLVVSSATATPSGTRAQATLQKDADALVAAGAPGVVLLSRAGNRTIGIASGLGEVSTKTPMRTVDRFRVASLAKTYTATVVLQLVGEGKLRLSDSGALASRPRPARRHGQHPSTAQPHQRAR